MSEGINQVQTMLDLYIGEGLISIINTYPWVSKF